MNRFLKYLILGLAINVGCYYGQTIKKKTSYRSSQVTIDRINVREALIRAESIFNDSIEEALTIVERNLFIAITHDFNEEEGLAYFTLGKFNQTLENYELAISNYNKAVSIYFPLESKEFLMSLQIRKAECFMELEKYKKAIIFFKKAKLNAEKIGDETKVLKLANEIGNCFLLTSDYKKSENYFTESLEKSQAIGNKESLINATIGLGGLAEKNGNLVQAEEYFIQAKDESEKMNSEELANISYNSLARIYTNQNSTRQVIDIQEQAYNFNTLNGSSSNVLSNTNKLASNYSQVNLDKNALDLLTQNSNLVTESGISNQQKLEYYNTLSDVYISQGSISKAGEVKRAYDVVLDSFVLEEYVSNNKKLKKKELVNLTQKKIFLLEKDRELNEKTILLLRKEQDLKSQTIERQQTVTIALVLGMVTVIILSLSLYRNNKQKQRSNELLKLKSLRNQMNPHFIFNSLNSVNSFIASKDERSANKYLTEFSKLMRNVLEYSQEDLIPLSKEIEILELYMGLEYFRFKDNFEFSITIDEHINREDCLIPPMLIQPFLENAIWHGLRYKKEKGNLDLSFVKRAAFIEVLIIDNGIGRLQSMAGKTINQKKMKSTGINNAKNRLEIIRSVFRKNIEVTINDLDVQTKEGTVVSLKVYS